MMADELDQRRQRLVQGGNTAVQLHDVSSDGFEPDQETIRAILALALCLELFLGAGEFKIDGFDGTELELGKANREVSLHDFERPYDPAADLTANWVQVWALIVEPHGRGKARRRSRQHEGSLECPSLHTKVYDEEQRL